MKSLEEESAIQRPLVAVVDDDESIRESLPDLLGEFGFRCEVFSSAERFLASDTVSQMKCVVLDIVMPGMTGFELQQELKVRGHNIPIVFMTAQKDEAAQTIQRHGSSESAQYGTWNNLSNGRSPGVLGEYNECDGGARS